jgi:hypothetical protein
MPHSFWRWRPAIEASGRCRGKEASQLLYSGTAFLSPECICRRTDGRVLRVASISKVLAEADFSNYAVGQPS